MWDAAELPRAMFRAIHDHDPAALEELFAADAVHTAPDGEPVTGPEPVIAEVQGFTEAFPDLAIELRRQHVPDASRSIVEYTFRGTHLGDLDGAPPTGRSVAVDACSVLEASDGAIQREADHYDTAVMLAQLDLASR
jgi:steroid delta-isomerase-like uncharacterized protein